SYEEVVKDKGYKNFSQTPLDIATEYSAADAHQTLQLMPILQEELKKQKMDILYTDIEFPLIHVLLKMEIEGIKCDKTILQELDIRISQDLKKTHTEIFSLIDDQFREINLNSPKQLEKLLFYELKLPPQKKNVKGTGYSTDQEVLEELAKIHPVPALIVRYRTLFKLKTTYIDALPKFINQKTGCIHTTFSQTRVATGRLASLEPNLQNIPTDIPEYNLHIRTAFIPKDGYLFLSADYSQIELRVLAYLSQDKKLIDAFTTGVDIHTQTASGIFEIPIEQVTKNQRQLGKRINFSILYGLTPYGLSKDLGISFSNAKTYIEKFFAQYPGVQSWMEKVITETKEQGFVSTLYGRRRSIPGIYEKNKQLYDLARRVAINTCAQGTAAEIMKKGMIQLDHFFKEKKIDAKILLQIHDELLISVSKNKYQMIADIVKEILEKVVTWNIPLEADIRIGKNWQEVTK
ncbi:MAG TPA: DNA polymerase, partial [Candidatus Babeliales bacterium]|nr:DNA polymerase [Candidatus Babeliales bacterium]